mgnify:CR=1 FL=1
MRKSVLHSNLLGRLGNGLLKFVLLVVLVCGWGSAFGAVNWNTSVVPVSDCSSPSVRKLLQKEVKSSSRILTTKSRKYS